MFPVIEYIRHYFIFIAALTVFYILGAVILRTAGAAKKIEGFYGKLFFNILTGMAAFIAVYSAIKTGFKTVNVIFFLIGGALLIENRHMNAELNIAGQPLKFPAKYALILFLGSLFIYSWSFFTIFKGGKFPYVIADYDYIFSSNISYFLGATGQENEFHILNLMSKGYHGLHPYHYFESWLNAGISEITKGLNIVTLFLSTLPVFYFLSFLGFLAIAEHYLLNAFTMLICFVSLFLGGLYFNFYDKGRALAEGASFNAPLMSAFIPKLSYFYVFISGFYLMYLKNQKTAAFLILLNLAVASFVACQPLIVGVIIFCLIGLKFNFMSRAELRRLLVYTLATALSIFLFYYIFDKNKAINVEGAAMKDIFGRFSKDFFTFETFKNRFNITVSTMLTMALLYLPLFLPLALLYRKSSGVLKKMIPGELFIFTAVIFIAGIILWSAVYRWPDGIALFYHLSIPLINCSLILLAICLIGQNISLARPPLRQRPLVYVCVFVCLFSSLNQVRLSYEHIKYAKRQKKYDDDYMGKIRSFLKDNKVRYGVSIKDKSEYGTIFSKYTACYALGGYLALLKNGVVPVSISDFDIPIAKERGIERQRDLDAVSAGIFYRFVEKQKKESAFRSVAQSQIDFMDIYKIEYAVISKAARIPAMIQGRVKQQFEDRFSGERFLIFQ